MKYLECLENVIDDNCSAFNWTESCNVWWASDYVSAHIDKFPIYWRIICFWEEQMTHTNCIHLFILLIFILFTCVCISAIPRVRGMCAQCGTWSSAVPKQTPIQSNSNIFVYLIFFWQIHGGKRPMFIHTSLGITETKWEKMVLYRFLGTYNSNVRPKFDCVIFVFPVDWWRQYCFSSRMACGTWVNTVRRHGDRKKHRLAAAKSCRK